MGQLLNRLRDFARTQMRSGGADLRAAQRTIDGGDDELRRIIEELHRDYTHGSNATRDEPREGPRRSSGATSMPANVLNAHTTLNVAVGASIDEIKKAYRNSIATWHPDKFATAAADKQRHAHTRAHEINSAYVTLRGYYEFR